MGRGPARCQRIGAHGVQRARRKCADCRNRPPRALPAWDLVDIEKYRRVWRRAHGYFSLNMAASRGCSFRCNWCAKPIWGNQYLQRPPREVAAEMIHLQRHYRPDHIWFADDIFGFKVDWVNEFAAALAEGGGGVPFTIQLRADLVSTRMAEALRHAGCREVWIGAESGSQKILDAMNKGTRVRENIHARRCWATPASASASSCSSAISARSSTTSSRRGAWSRRRGPTTSGVSVSYPLPGTKFYEAVKQQLGEKTPLAGEQRPRHDVRRHLPLGVLPRGAQPAARPGDASRLARGGAALGRAVRERSATTASTRGIRCPRSSGRVGGLHSATAFR